jgi:hypothetical protein
VREVSLKAVSRVTRTHGVLVDDMLKLVVLLMRSWRGGEDCRERKKDEETTRRMVERQME